MRKPCYVREVDALEPTTNVAVECLVSGVLRIAVPVKAFKPGDYFVHIPRGVRLPAWLSAQVGLPVGELGPTADGWAYAVHSAQSNSGEDYADLADSYHYIKVDREVFGVAGFVVYLGDDVAHFLNLN